MTDMLIYSIVDVGSGTNWRQLCQQAKGAGSSWIVYPTSAGVVEGLPWYGDFVHGHADTITPPPLRDTYTVEKEKREANVIDISQARGFATEEEAQSAAGAMTEAGKIAREGLRLRGQPLERPAPKYTKKPMPDGMGRLHTSEAEVREYVKKYGVLFDPPLTEENVPDIMQAAKELKPALEALQRKGYVELLPDEDGCGMRVKVTEAGRKNSKRGNLPI